ncbi:hypothetical protein MKW92_026002 [Papaver armeniacum]|nr:hypothetical protein MKW92_026002 [Papaver armeniacum]
MDTRRRNTITTNKPPRPSSLTNLHQMKTVVDNKDIRKRGGGPLQEQPPRSPKASDALPLPLYLTNGVFFTLFFSVAYFLLHRWREKIRSSTPLHVVTLSEIAAIVSLIASFIYLLGFFGIDFVQSVSTREDENENEHHQFLIEEEDRKRPGPCPASLDDCTTAPSLPPLITPSSEEDEEVIKSVVSGIYHRIRWNLS